MSTATLCLEYHTLYYGFHLQYLYRKVSWHFATELGIVVFSLILLVTKLLKRVCTPTRTHNYRWLTYAVVSTYTYLFIALYDVCLERIKILAADNKIST